MNNQKRRELAKKVHTFFADLVHFNAADRKEDYSVSDIITDLLHFAKSKRMDVDGIMARAIDHFEYEQKHPNE